MKKYSAINAEDAISVNPLVAAYWSQGFKSWNAPAELDDFIKQIKSKKNTFLNRKVLHQAFQDTYIKANMDCPENVDFLLKDNVYTITTGHQLNLFSGPAFFVIKIAQAIQLARALNAYQNEYHFVPVYWMASEDHDLEEIQSVNWFNGTCSWNRKDEGKVVGRLDLDDFDTLFSAPQDFLSQELLKELKFIYQNANTLAEAHIKVVQHLFKSEKDLLILDPDHKELKKQFVPVMKKELEHKWMLNKITATLDSFEKDYKVQVNPRSCHLFYINENNDRLRIDHDNEGEWMVDGEAWSHDFLLKRLNQFPENFSPNALMRPLYQECVLPNVAYIGGWAEVAYWLELEGIFAEGEIDRPLLIPRKTMVFLSKEQKNKWLQLNSLNSLFKNDLDRSNEDIAAVIAQNNSLFENFKEELDVAAEKMNEPYLNIQENYLHNWEGIKKKFYNKIRTNLKNIEKLERQKLQSKREKEQALKAEIFPKGKLNERVINWFELSLKSGEGDHVSFLIEEIEGLNFKEIDIIEY